MSKNKVDIYKSIRLKRLKLLKKNYILKNSIIRKKKTSPLSLLKCLFCFNV